MKRQGNPAFAGAPEDFIYPCYVWPHDTQSLSAADQLPARYMNGVDRVFCDCSGSGDPNKGRWVKPYVMVDCRNWPPAFFTLNNIAPRKWACDGCWSGWARLGFITPGDAGDAQGSFDESVNMEYGGAPDIYVQAERDYQDRQTQRARGEVHDAAGNIISVAAQQDLNKHGQPWRGPNQEIIRPSSAAVLMEDPATGRMVPKPNQRPPAFNNMGQRETHAERKTRLDNGG